MDYKLVSCPKCGKKHFKKVRTSSTGSTLDWLFGSKHYPEEIYLDGELSNPEQFIPDPVTEYFSCLECGCNFSVKVTFNYNKPETYETVNEDEGHEARMKELEQRIAEANRKKEAEIADPPGTFTIGEQVSLMDLSDTSSEIVECIGTGNKSTIDLGGFIINSDTVYTAEQISKIKELLGWEVTNN